MSCQLLTGSVDGNIYVSFKLLRRAEAMVVAGGRVVYAGERNVVETVIETLGGELVDLGVRLSSQGL